MFKLNKVRVIELSDGKEYDVEINGTKCKIKVPTKTKTKEVGVLVDGYNLKAEMSIIEHAIVLSLKRNDVVLLTTDGKNVDDLNDNLEVMIGTLFNFYQVPVISIEDNVPYSHGTELIPSGVPVVSGDIEVVYDGINIKVSTVDGYTIFQGVPSRYLDIFGIEPTNFYTPVLDISLLESDVYISGSDVYVRPTVSIKKLEVLPDDGVVVWSDLSMGRNSMDSSIVTSDIGLVSMDSICSIPYGPSKWAYNGFNGGAPTSPAVTETKVIISYNGLTVDGVISGAPISKRMKRDDVLVLIKSIKELIPGKIY